MRSLNIKNLPNIIIALTLKYTSICVYLLNIFLTIFNLFELLLYAQKQPITYLAAFDGLYAILF